MAKQIVLVETSSSMKLRIKNSNMVLEDCEGKAALQNSMHRIFLIFVLGETSITSVFIKEAKKHAVPIIFLNYNLRAYHAVFPDDRGNFLLRKKQYESKDNFAIAKKIVLNKAENQLFLANSLRYKTYEETEAIEKLKGLIRQVATAKDDKELLGIEGNISRLYFATYFKNMDFKGRQPRCKADPINLLLDIGYHYLFNFIEANLRLYDFDLYCGVYHKFFYQRKSLVCDIIEPFRPIIDRQVRKMHNLGQMKEDRFESRNGQFYPKPEHSKEFSAIFMKEILAHKEDIFLYAQAYYRAFMKRKDISQYPEFWME